ncbi:50S ribosomal protein L10 [Petrocella sp. FN5]|uniref:50S ribosomal protein L10 n=1 Tax=Petrocella sp. FN5 TaxID=3032002 RepID=UPI0023DA0B15|nr:50S ribosomal protein L10 [Petrocella sp. FN5]MDF1616005.1 50S ribosomal protein L10 [Petrocella sp. FN5]
MPRIEEKQSVIKTIKDSIEGATSIVLVDYRGLSVEQDTELRKSLREANVTYKVFKNSMMSFAFQGTEFEALEKHLAGPSAIAISYEDPTAGPRVLLKQSKAFKNLEFKAGVVEGVYYDDATIVKIAAIPSREELLSKLLGSIKSPISTFARTIKAVADKAAETGVATAAELVSDNVAVVAEPVAEVVEEVAVETEVTTIEKTE